MRHLFISVILLPFCASAQPSPSPAIQSLIERQLAISQTDEFTLDKLVADLSRLKLKYSYVAYSDSRTLENEIILKRPETLTPESIVTALASNKDVIVEISDSGVINIVSKKAMKLLKSSNLADIKTNIRLEEGNVISAIEYISKITGVFIGGDVSGRDLAHKATIRSGDYTNTTALDVLLNVLNNGRQVGWRITVCDNKDAPMGVFVSVY